LRTISPIKLLGGRKEGDYKNKIVVALKEIEIQRRELEGLKGRLSERRQTLFDSTVRALQEKNRPKASVYASEHTELRKTIRIVEASELALTQVSLRLQSIMEVGDAMVHVGAAFKSIKSVSKTMEDFGPALDATSASINSTLTETMAQMGQISPGISVDVHTENAEDLVAQAQKFAEEQAEKLKRSLHVMPSRYEEEIHQTDDHIPILATGEDGEDGEESIVLGTIFGPSTNPKVEGEVLRYATAHDGVIDISETSVNLGIPQDEVELSTIRLVAAGKVKSQHRSE
jgi:division protein CdvB (Snf7/Vps24/ESCRT-III family)